MAHKTPFWFQVTALVGALSAGCAAHPAQPKAARAPARDCTGGAIASSSDLARFSGCTAVKGDLAIVGTGLRGLGALGSLRSVSGTLTISDNAQLRSLKGLGSLSRAHAVTVLGNPVLATLEGLERLTRLHALDIRHNGIHATLGMDGLREVEHLTISGNPGLISLAGLNRLERVKTAKVEQNPLLCAQLGWFDGLALVEQDLSIIDNYGISARDADRLQTQVGRRASAEHKLGLQEYASFER